MKVIVWSTQGTKSKEVTLPAVFQLPVDKGLIRRAVLAIQSARLQPKGVFPEAGRQNSAEYVGVRWLPGSERTINSGHARLPRMKDRRNLMSGRVARLPQAVGGTRAHPPKTQKRIRELINKKEKQKALKCAIAATAQKVMVEKHGHVFPSDTVLPLVVENSFESLAKTKEVVAALTALKLIDDVKNAKSKKRTRAGKGKMRGRRFKRKKSVLIITSNNAAVYRAARNLEGVDIVSVKNLNAELLAPGAEGGRLTLWTEGSLNEVEKKFAQ